MTKLFKTFSAICMLSMISLSNTVYAWEPTKPITIVVPSAPGSVHDQAVRQLLPYLEKTAKVTVIVENKPGAGHTMGIRHFQTLPDDNHKIIAVSSIGHMMDPFVYPDAVRWDPIEDFTFTVSTLSTPLVISSSATGNIKTLGDLVERIKDTSQMLTVSIVFPNQQALITSMAEQLGVKNINHINFVRYPNANKALTDVVNSNIDIAIGGVGPTISLKDAGKINWVASTADKPLDFLPGLETVNSKFPGLTQVTTIGFLLAKDVPAEVVNWYVQNLTLAANSASATDFRKNVRAYLDPRAQTPIQLKQIFIDTRNSLEPTYKDLSKSN
jgi:tripartite-type tricarboxylate transporter receptor subunit TctC